MNCYDFGIKIGFIDNNGIELCLGDNVDVTIKTTLPNWDGWGRDIQGSKEERIEIKEYKGTVIYKKEMAEYLVEIKGWTYFSLIYFDKIKKSDEK